MADQNPTRILYHKKGALLKLNIVIIRAYSSGLKMDRAAAVEGIFFTGSIVNIFPYSNSIHKYHHNHNGMDLRPDSY